MNNNKLKNIWEKLILIIIDLLSIYLSLILSFYLRKFVIPYIIRGVPPFEQRLSYYLYLYWIPPIYLFFNIYHGLYAKTRIFWEDAKEYCISYFLSFIIVLTISVFSRESHKISRIVIVLFFINSIWINLLLRYLVKCLLYNFELFKKNVLIIGAGETGRLLYNSLENDRYLGYKVVCFIDKRGEELKNQFDGVEIFSSVDEFKKGSKDKDIEKVFIAIPSLDSTEMMDLYNKFHRQFKEVVIIPQVRALALTNSEIQYFFNNDLLLLTIRNNLNYKINRIFKNIFDYILVILLIPFFLVIGLIISVLIKIDSKGPIFYKHLRYSLNGKRIKIYKFRSMYENSDQKLKEILERDELLREEWEKNYKIKNDPRITKIGKFLRKTSLDEIPQIINVFKGEMSIIGPRPVVKEELKKYYHEYSEYFCNIKSGITGLWQVSGRSDTDYSFRIRSDLWYVLNWSIWVDVVILLKTIIVVFKGKGAY